MRDRRHQDGIACRDVVGRVSKVAPNPLPNCRLMGALEFSGLAIRAAEFVRVIRSPATHNPKVGGSNPPPATNQATESSPLPVAP